MKFLSAVLVALVATVAQASEPTLSLTGVGTVSVKPDEGYVTFSVTTDAPSASESVRMSTKAMQTVFTTLNSINISEDNIATLQYSVSQKWKEVPTGEVNTRGATITKTIPDGYTTSNTVRVTVCDLSQFGDVLDAIVNSGANKIHSISFGSSKASEYLREARCLAVKSAVAKAEDILGTLGNVKAVRVLNISERNVSRYEGLSHRSAMADSPYKVPVSAGSLSYTISVSITWELDNESSSTKILID